MATTTTQIRIDASIKQEASALFSRLGLDNVQCSKYVPVSMRPSRRTSRDPDVKGYSSMEDLKEALDD